MQSAFTIVLSLVTFAVAETPSRSLSVPACAAPGLPMDERRAEVFERLNRYRLRLGLSALRYSKSLELAANEHARDMFIRGYVAHQAPDGGSPADRAQEAGFCHRGVGENIYWGMNRVSTPTEAMQGWKRSAGHDRNMRHASYRFVGVGLHVQKRDGDMHYHWVQVFGNP